MWCWCFELTKRMTKPNCGTYRAHSSSKHKPTVLLNSCKTRPQPSGGRAAAAGTIQQEQGSLFLDFLFFFFFLPEVKFTWSC